MYIVTCTNKVMCSVTAFTTVSMFNSMYTCNHNLLR